MFCTSGTVIPLGFFPTTRHISNCFLIVCPANFDTLRCLLSLHSHLLPLSFQPTFSARLLRQWHGCACCVIGGAWQSTSLDTSENTITFGCESAYRTMHTDQVSISCQPPFTQRVTYACYLRDGCNEHSGPMHLPLNRTYPHRAPSSKAQIAGWACCTAFTGASASSLHTAHGSTDIVCTPELRPTCEDSSAPHRLHTTEILLIFIRLP